MKPFLLLSTRPEDEAAAGELASVRSLAGLGTDELVQIRVEVAPLTRLDPADYAGVFLGGGPFNSSDSPKEALQLRVEQDLGVIIDEVLERELPFLGLCYGIGALSSRIGGLVDRRFGEPAGVTTVQLTDAGRVDPLFAGVPDDFAAFVGHKEAARRLAPEAVLLASGAACPVQAFRFGPRAYATQFHPELDPHGMASRIRIYSSAGYFPPETTEELVEQVSNAVISPEVHLVLSNFVALSRQHEASLICSTPSAHR